MTQRPYQLSTRYSFYVTIRDDAIVAYVENIENKRDIEFVLAGRAKIPNAVLHMYDHLDSMTDELFDFWLDPERKAQQIAIAKAAEKEQRARLQAQAQQEREAKAKKKEENRRKQSEAVQRKQEAESN